MAPAFPEPDSGSTDAPISLDRPLRRHQYDVTAPLDPEVAKRLDAYRCRSVPSGNWDRVRDFSIGTAKACRPDLEACCALALALARVGVYSLSLGMPLERKVILTPRHLESFVRHLRGVGGVRRSGPVLSEESTATTISFLHRAGRALNPAAPWPPLKVSLPKKAAKDPYTRAEEDHFLYAARRLEPSNALPLVALGFGLPLTGGELPQMRPSDFVDDGVHLWARSPASGLLLPMRDRYVGDMRAILERSSDDTYLLGDKYIVKDRVSRIGSRLDLHGRALNSSRMLSTWIVRVMSAGADVRFLFEVLGSKSTTRIYTLSAFVDPFDSDAEHDKAFRA